jgi:hypothetical protein
MDPRIFDVCKAFTFDSSNLIKSIAYNFDANPRFQSFGQFVIFHCLGFEVRTGAIPSRPSPQALVRACQAEASPHEGTSSPQGTT